MTILKYKMFFLIVLAIFFSVSFASADTKIVDWYDLRALTSKVQVTPDSSFEPDPRFIDVTPVGSFTYPTPVGDVKEKINSKIIIEKDGYLIFKNEVRDNIGVVINTSSGEKIPILMIRSNYKYKKCPWTMPSSSSSGCIYSRDGKVLYDNDFKDHATTPYSAVTTKSGYLPQCPDFTYGTPGNNTPLRCGSNETRVELKAGDELFFYGEDSNEPGGTGLEIWEYDQEPTCSEDIDCGSSGFIDDPFCSEDKVTRTFEKFTCINPGTSNSFCSSSLEDKTLEICEYQCSEGQCTLPESICGNGILESGEQCDDGNNNDFDSCSNSCETQTITCSEDIDCGEVSESSAFCSNNLLVKNVTTPVCINHGYPQSQCLSNTNQVTIKQCAFGCSNSQCNEDRTDLSCVEAKLLGLLSGQISGNNATVVNNANSSYHVGLASYKKYDNFIGNQTIYDFDTVFAHSTTELSVELPICAYQIDLFCGPVIFDFSTGERYGSRLLDAESSTNLPFCSVEQKFQESTIVAHKIVCNNESHLPNWGSGGQDISGTTALNFVNSNPNCHFEENWSFQWKSDPATNPGDNSEFASGWNTFGPTDTNGAALEIINISGISKVWLRESLKSGYLNFTGQNTNKPVSAEFYCDKDVINYDNLEHINLQGGKVHYCVAFNVKSEVIPEPEQICGNGILESGEQCDDGNNNDFDSCSNSCEVQTIACNQDSQCSDGNPLTFDQCINPGTSASECRNTVINCASNLDCGSSGFIGQEFCSQNNIMKNFANHSCINPGTLNSFCVSTVQQQTIQQCQFTCSDAACIRCNQDSQCNDNDSSTVDSCINPGTIDSFCQNNPLPPENITCHVDLDCGSSGFIDDPFCSESKVSQNFETHTCINPGTSNSFCSSTVETKTLEICAYQCSNASCINPPIADPISLLIHSPENIVYNTTLIPLNISSNGLVIFSIDSGANQSYSGPTTLNLSEGNHTLTAYANTSLGNSTSRSVSFSISLPVPQNDSDPIFLTINSPTNSTINSSQILIDISSNGENIWFSIDSGNNETYSSPILRALSFGQHTLTAYANTSLGNSTSRQVTFTLFNTTSNGNGGGNGGGGGGGGSSGTTNYYFTKNDSWKPLIYYEPSNTTETLYLSPTAQVEEEKSNLWMIILIIALIIFIIILMILIAILSGVNSEE